MTIITAKKLANKERIYYSEGKYHKSKSFDNVELRKEIALYSGG